MPLAFKGVAIDVLAGAEQTAKTIGELKFAAGAKRCTLQCVKDRWGKNVAADDGEIGRRLLRFGLLHQVAYVVRAAVVFALDSLSVQHAIRGNGRAVNFLRRNDGAL